MWPRRPSASEHDLQRAARRGRHRATFPRHRGGGVVLGGAAPATRVVETPQGRVSIPVTPRRVVAIDSRSNLEPALLFGLPVIGYSHSPARPWVPVPAETRMLRAPPDWSRSWPCSRTW